MLASIDDNYDHLTIFDSIISMIEREQWRSRAALKCFVSTRTHGRTLILPVNHMNCIYALVFSIVVARMRTAKKMKSFSE